MTLNFTAVILSAMTEDKVKMEETVDEGKKMMRSLEK